MPIKANPANEGNTAGYRQQKTRLTQLEYRVDDLKALVERVKDLEDHDSTNRKQIAELTRILRSIYPDEFP